MLRNSFILLFLLAATSVSAQSDPNTQFVNKWISAWELVAKKVFNMQPSNTPEMLFFDKDFVYSTSRISIPEGISFSGPGLFGKQLEWRRSRHNGTLILPTGDKVPVGIMSFAGPVKEGENNSFFVMAAPSFWSAAGVKSNSLDYEQFLTGIFLHEFAHTQQVNGFGLTMGSLEKKYKFEDLNDDFLEDHYKTDSVYVQQFNNELSLFHKAAFSDELKTTKETAKLALIAMKKRQERYFIEDKAVYSTLDQLFLTMEGLGQYAAVSWLMHPEGGKLSFKDAANGFSRKGGRWSQEEGLLLFLILDKLKKPDWQHTMFSADPAYITTLLNNAVNH